MLFFLDVLSNAKPKRLLFDNLSTRFSDADTGMPFFEDARIQHFARHSDKIAIKRQDIRSLQILLGLSCNFDCRYCHQRGLRHSSGVTPITPDRVPGLIKLLKERDVRADRVSLRGGEPLVYWKTLSVLIPALREIYPKAKIGFPTNGSLLTDEILNFLVRWNVGFTLSYDGRTTNRDRSILDDPVVCDALARYSHRTGCSRSGLFVMPTVNRCYVSPADIYKEMSGKGIRVDDIAVYSIARCNPFNNELAAEIEVPPQIAATHSSLIYDILHKRVPDLHLYRTLQNRFEYALNSYYTGIVPECKFCSMCGNSIGGNITVDCTGEIWSCMNIPSGKLGNIADENLSEVTSVYRQAYQRKPCRECPFILSCTGGCPLQPSDNSMSFKVNCANLKIMAEPFFRTVVECLFGVYLKKIIRADTGTVVAEY